MVILYILAYVIVAACVVFGLSAMVHDVFIRPSLAQSSHAPEFLLSYHQIALMEQAIWGQTFHNPDPAEGRSCACDTCTFGNTPHTLTMKGEHYIRPIINIMYPAWQDTENPKETE